MFMLSITHTYMRAQKFKDDGYNYDVDVDIDTTRRGKGAKIEPETVIAESVTMTGDLVRSPSL